MKGAFVSIFYYCLGLTIVLVQTVLVVVKVNTNETTLLNQTIDVSSLPY